MHTLNTVLENADLHMQTSIQNVQINIIKKFLLTFGVEIPVHLVRNK